MKARLTQLASTALYQLTVAIGIVLLPIAVLANRLGIVLPIRSLLKTAEQVHNRHA